MMRICMQRLLLFMCCCVGFIILASSSAAIAHAAGAQLTITQPSVNNQPIGRPGTTVVVTGTNFGKGNGSVNLYVTQSNDGGKCQQSDNPAALGLSPVVVNQPVMARNGAFTATFSWPQSAATPGMSYYVCGVLQGKDVTALSTNAFMVASSPTVTLSTSSVAQGGQVTITGTNWVPPQVLLVGIVPPNQDGVVASDRPTPDAQGNFRVTLTIPVTTAPGMYYGERQR